MIGAFFDVDGTLYTANMWRGLMQYASSHGRANQARLYFLRHIPLYYLRKLNLIDEETFRKPWILNLGGLLQGWSAEQGDAAFRWVAEQYIRPSARNDVIARLNQHLAQGHFVILVSGMIVPTLRCLADELKVSAAIGTEIEIVDGKYTGRVIPPACMGAEKERLTRNLLSARGIEIDFASSYAYADSISDTALFGMVGHPIAVYPDAKLAALARERSWEIIGTEK